MNLIPLHDGRPGLRTLLQVEAREPVRSELEIANHKSQIKNPDTLDFISSTATLDRYQEIIDPAGWRLESYRRNPVFQNAHQYGDILFTLGKALITEVRSAECGVGNAANAECGVGNGECGMEPEPAASEKRLVAPASTASAAHSPLRAQRSAPTPHSALRTPHLYQRIEFATDVNPMARIAYGLYKGAFLNAVSVGFIPLRWEDPPPGSGRVSPNAPRRRYLEQELLEVSAVAIPANPDALALGLKSGSIIKADLVETLELLRCLTTPRSISAPTATGAAGPMGASLLITFARELQRILRHA